MRLQGKKIILGITGSIAAYKSAFLTRLLIKEGAQVKVVMTPLAKEFITPVTMATLSQNTVLCDFFNHDNGDWNSHVELGLWADIMLVAPASANTLAKMAHGIADNLLLTTYLSVRCPVMVAPAMDMDMFSHPATQENLQILLHRNVQIVEPATGELASKLQGKGRMEELDKIVDVLAAFFEQQKKKISKHFLVTAGPTFEPIDPVRFIGNHSSGKMGYAIAAELLKNGMKVTLVSGPVSIQLSHPLLNIIPVNTAQEMFEASAKIFESCDGAILCAAVADYTPLETLEKKIKRTDGYLTLQLKPTADIAAALGKSKRPNQILVGFALETNNELAHAIQKLHKKNLDFIVLNSLAEPGAGFKHDTNKITILDKEGNQYPFSLKSKTDVALDIVNYLIQYARYDQN